MTAAGLAVALQLVGLYRPAGPPEPLWLPGADKIGHALIFALPVMLIVRAAGWFRRQAGRALTPTPIAVVATLFAAHALASEIIQHTFYVHRSGDPYDLLADLAGIGLGALAGWRVGRR